MAHLEVSDVTAHYGSHEVLKGVGFGVDRGEVVALVGPSGSGKSTVLRVLVGLLKPTAGKVSVSGEAVDYANAGSVRKVRDRMAIVFQQYNLFQNMDTLRNVTITPTRIKKRPRAEVTELAKGLLARVGLADKLHAYPDELSGGQQQRVAIARALALKPEILLLDEVTSALDPELVGEVLAVIADLAREGRTMLLVTHEMKFAREVANHVVFLADGVIEEEGPPDVVYSAPKSERLQKFLATVQ